MKTLKWQFFSPFILFLTLVLGVSATRAEIVAPEDYPFFVKNAYLATILGSLSHATAPYQVIQVPFRTDREMVSLALFAQPEKKAPLAFVISGTGGDSLGSRTLYLASELFQLGYHVVTLPNPISGAYAQGMSESTVPGFLPRDSQELYQHMKKLTAHLEAEFRISFESYALAGYSYGGLLAGFLAQVDQNEGYFKFNRIAIINPAIDIAYNVDTLDRFYDEGKGVPVEISAQFMNVHESGFFDFSDQLMRWLIGGRFREKLTTLILASQDVKDTGILKPIDPHHSAKDRHAEAAGISFQEYMVKQVNPTVFSEKGTPLSPAEVSRRGSLYPLTRFLSTHPQVYVFENADDFLLKPGDVDYLKVTMGERLYLYPYGGHCGNFTFEKNQHDFQAVFKLQ